MKTSERGLALIKYFEGFSPKAIKLAGESHYTIGYGHYGSDVQPNQTITEQQADALLRKDVIIHEEAVTRYVLYRMRLNQNQFDALVSFSYNCGPENLRRLVKDRNPDQIAAHMMVYTHSGSEAYNVGLYNRRKREQSLFLEPMECDEMERWQKISDVPEGYYRDNVRRLVDNGVLYGTSDGLNLTEDMLRTILIVERIVNKITD